jgi:hypothetical protein
MYLKTRIFRHRTDWSMGSAKGNKRLTVLADKTYDAVDALEDTEGNRSQDAVKAELVKMIKTFLGLWSTKTYAAASKPEVRRNLHYFCLDLAEASGAFTSREATDLMGDLSCEFNL